jgi:hypothetical protein
VCGDCCTLTEGGLKPYAICLDCDRRSGSSLSHAWTRFVIFIGVILATLAAIVALLHACE